MSEFSGMPIEERFAAQTVDDPDTGCILWKGSTHRQDYGQIRVGARRVRVHRFVWERAYGPIPEGLCVLHRCDNRPCVNVDHLFLGTIADNNADKAAKGRCAPQDGSANPNARLTADQVLAIRADSRRQSEIAADYGITQVMVSRIKSRKRWGHLDAREVAA